MSSPMYSMNDRQSSIYRQATLQRLDQARQAAGDDSALQRLDADVRTFYDDLDAFEQADERVGADPMLSPEGKRTKRTKLLEAWETTSAEQVERITSATQRLSTPDPRKVTPKPPADDPVTLEAKLANARSDARMMLDQAEVNVLPDRMKELVEHDADPAISYLLVGTNWGTNYVRSRLPANERQQHGSLVVWDRHKNDLTRRLLDEPGRKAFDRAAALRPLGQVGTIVHATREFKLRDRGNRR